jgi:hypothetical protein
MPVLRSKVKVRSAKCELLTSMCVAPSPLGALVLLGLIEQGPLGGAVPNVNAYHTHRKRKYLYSTDTEAQKRLGATRITCYTLHFALYTSLHSILKKIPKNKIN